jgi:hypothetical protein
LARNDFECKGIVTFCKKEKIGEKHYFFPQETRKRIVTSSGNHDIARIFRLGERL